MHSENNLILKKEFFQHRFCYIHIHNAKKHWYNCALFFAFDIITIWFKRQIQLCVQCRKKFALKRFQRSTFIIMVLVTILLSKRFIIVPDNWVENTTIREETKIFFSPDSSTKPNFQLAEKFLFNKDAAHVYKGYVLKHFGTYHSSFNTYFKMIEIIIRNDFEDSEVDAAKYIENKRPVFPLKYNKDDYNNVRVAFDRNPLEQIDLSSDSDSDTEAPEEMVKVISLFLEPKIRATVNTIKYQECFHLFSSQM